MKCIFFIITFDSIYSRILPLIEEKKDTGEIIIVTTTEQIEMFFKNYTDFKVIRTKVHPDLITRKTKHKIFLNIISSKMEFKELFKDIENSEIYFCSRGCAVVIYSYIKKLLKRNKVFFCGEDHGIDDPIEHSLRAFVMKWIVKWLMGVETVVYNTTGVPRLELDKKFFENIEIIGGEAANDKLLDKYAVKLDILKGKEILIIMQDMLETGTNFAEPVNFIHAMDGLMDILEEEMSRSRNVLVITHSNNDLDHFLPLFVEFKKDKTKNIAALAFYNKNELLLNRLHNCICRENNIQLQSYTDLSKLQLFSNFMVRMFKYTIPKIKKKRYTGSFFKKMFSVDSPSENMAKKYIQTIDSILANKL